MPEDKDLSLNRSELKAQDAVDYSPEERRKLVSSFYSQHREIIALARKYGEHPGYRKFHDTVRVARYSDPFVAYCESAEALPVDYRLPNVLFGLADYGDKSAEHADKVGVDTSTRLDVSLYLDSETTEKYRKYVLGRNNFTIDNLRTYYFYNEAGDFQKIQETDEEFDSGNDDLYITRGYPGNKHGFKSDITPADFAVVGTSLRLAKEGFMKAIRDIDPDLAAKVTAESSIKSIET